MKTIIRVMSCRFADAQPHEPKTEEEMWSCLAKMNAMGQDIGKEALRLAKKERLNIEAVAKGLTQLMNQYDSRTLERELVFTIRGFFRESLGWRQ